MAFDPYQPSGSYTAEQEIAETVMSEILPSLRKLLAGLHAMQEVWLVNGIAAKIEAAAVAGEPLAGYAPSVWVAWGTVFTETLAFLDVPIASLDKTPRQVLLTRYTRG